MEEKLRNLSQNIANNTGEEHKPKKHNSGEEKPWEEHDAPEEEHTEEVSDYAPEPENEPEDEPQDDEESAEENRDSISDATPVDENEEKSSETEPEDEPEEPEDEPEKEPEEPEETPKDEPEPEAIEIKREEPKILSMETEDEEPQEPQESPTRTKKYSPEVEAALNRLNSEDVAVDFNTEPLSTEPKKRRHHAGRIFLFFLFIIAIAAVVLCVLVEQKVIDNPLDLISGKKPESSQVTTDEKETELTDQALIKSIDSLFVALHDNDNYYIYNRAYRLLDGKEYIYYDVAEPAEKVEAPALNGELTETAETTETTENVTTTEATDNCANADGAEATNCITTAVEPVSADNYENYPHYRYIFVKNINNAYEFREKHLINDTEEK